MDDRLAGARGLDQPRLPRMRIVLATEGYRRPSGGTETYVAHGGRAAAAARARGARLLAPPRRHGRAGPRAAGSTSSGARRARASRTTRGAAQDAATPTSSRAVARGSAGVRVPQRDVRPPAAAAGPGAVQAVVVMSERFAAAREAPRADLAMVRMRQPIDTEWLVPRRAPSATPAARAAAGQLPDGRRPPAPGRHLGRAGRRGGPGRHPHPPDAAPAGRHRRTPTSWWARGGRSSTRCRADARLRVRRVRRRRLGDRRDLRRDRGGRHRRSGASPASSTPHRLRADLAAYDPDMGQRQPAARSSSTTARGPTPHDLVALCRELVPGRHRGRSTEAAGAGAPGPAALAGRGRGCSACAESRSSRPRATRTSRRPRRGRSAARAAPGRAEDGEAAPSRRAGPAGRRRAPARPGPRTWSPAQGGERRPAGEPRGCGSADLGSHRDWSRGGT